VTPTAGRSAAAIEGSAPAGPGTSRHPALALFLLLFGFYALWAGGHTYSSDEEGYYQQALALSRGERLIAFDEDNAQVTAARRVGDGEFVAAANIGAPLAAVPLALAGRAAAGLVPPAEDAVVQRLAVGFTNAWVTALTAVVVFLLALELGAARRPALLLAVVFGVGTMAWHYSGTLLFSEPLTALLVSAGVLFAVRAARRSPLPWAPLAGLAAGAAVLARSSALPFLAIIGAYLAAALVKRRGLRAAVVPVLGYAVGGAMALGVAALFNQWRYGDSIETGYGDVPLDGSLVEGLRGLFLSPGKSLFLYAPVAIVALVGLPVALRRVPLEALAMLALIVANVAIFARFVNWHGDHSWGPRYLMIVLPLVVALCAPLLASVAWRRAVAVAGVAGVLVGFLGAVLYFNQYYYIAFERLGAEAPPGTPGPVLLERVRDEPEWSPIVRHALLLDDVASNSAARLDGDDPSFHLFGNFPGATTARYFWYFAPPQLDAWWYYAFPQGTSKKPLLLVPLFLGCVVVGTRGVRRALEPSARVDAAPEGVLRTTGVPA
jgi:hypothetical protein